MKTFFERSFTDEEMDSIDAIKEAYSHLIDARVINFFIAVDQHLDTDYAQHLKWMLEMYLHRKNRAVTKETILNAVWNADNLNMMDKLIKCETFEEVDETFRNIDDTVVGDIDDEIIYDGYEWLIFRSENGNNDNLGAQSWNIAMNTPYIFIINKLFESDALKFAIKSRYDNEVDIFSGISDIDDGISSETAIEDLISENGYHFSPEVREVLLNMTITSKPYNMDEINRYWEERQRDDFYSESKADLIDRMGWASFLKYMNIEKFAEDFQPVSSPEDNIKDVFHNNSEELIDAVIMSTPDMKLRKELGVASSTEVYDYLMKNYRSIDFDIMIDNMSYGSSPSLRDRIIARAPDRNIKIETLEDVIRTLDIPLNETSYTQIKNTFKRIEDDYDMEKYIDYDKMFEDSIAHYDDDDKKEWYRESGYGENEENFISRPKRRR